MSDENTLRDALVTVGANYHKRGWSPATSGNYSARLDAERMVITRSGLDKGNLDRSAFLLADLQGKPLSEGKPSAETALHAMLYRLYPRVGSVLHTHLRSGVVFSRLVEKKKWQFEGWELQKAFSGITSHEQSLRLPIFDNDQDMDGLATRVQKDLRSIKSPCFGFLLRGHGLYAWGATIEDAMRHTEAFDDLIQCELAMRQYRG